MPRAEVPRAPVYLFTFYLCEVSAVELALPVQSLGPAAPYLRLAVAPTKSAVPRSGTGVAMKGSGQWEPDSPLHSLASV